MYKDKCLNIFLRLLVSVHDQCSYLDRLPFVLKGDILALDLV